MLDFAQRPSRPGSYKDRQRPMRSAPIPFILVLALGLAACGRSPWAPPAAPAAGGQQADDGDGGYRAPPRVRQAVRGADGDVTLSGVSLPGALMRLSSPSGGVQQTTADGAGAWSLPTQAGPPAIYGLSQETGGRRDQAQGYVVVLPGPGLTAAELRSGAGAMVLAGGPGAVKVNAVDFDASGAAVISGWARPNQPLRVMVDGAAADEGAALASGRFFLALPKPLVAGKRMVSVVSQGGQDQVEVDATPAQPFQGAMRAVQYGAAWRIDWMTPAGGGQTTVLFGAGAGS